MTESNQAENFPVRVSSSLQIKSLFKSWGRWVGHPPSSVASHLKAASLPKSFLNLTPILSQRLICKELQMWPGKISAWSNLICSPKMFASSRRGQGNFGGVSFRICTTKRGRGGVQGIRSQSAAHPRIPSSTPARPPPPSLPLPAQIDVASARRSCCASFLRYLLSSPLSEVRTLFALPSHLISSRIPNVFHCTVLSFPRKIMYLPTQS